ncbi:cytochrome c oxidase subunit 4 [Marininema mesophilum]|uniref:Cytochrome c oxidase subunit 4 n=1 Tax=Marininema mesophilum TaxID=1048340 RepID=A0A1H2YNE3_9BACL|nr:cytochrome C oxidase subunit IV family protein [Marininema mesophilum]SDX06706.1 cytochrome c oxidase subunit 4 [Marininema mesophilum]
MAEIQPSTKKKAQPKAKSVGEAKYVLPFVWMLLMTAASFVLVSTGFVPLRWLIPIIILLAIAQVMVQLFTFMHLEDKGTRMFIIFTSGGAFVAVTCILAMLYLA